MYIVKGLEGVGFLKLNPKEDDQNVLSGQAAQRKRLDPATPLYRGGTLRFHYMDLIFSFSDASL